MYKVNESQMANSHVDTVVDDAPLKLDILNDDMWELVHYTKAIGSDFSEQVNNYIQLFNILMENVSLPEFSYGEKVVIASCFTSVGMNKRCIEMLPQRALDVMIYELTPSDLRELSVSEKDLVAKIIDLDFVQRVKLVFTIYHEFF